MAKEKEKFLQTTESKKSTISNVLHRQDGIDKKTISRHCPLKVLAEQRILPPIKYKKGAKIWDG
jgi:hypothetical protein